MGSPQKKFVLVFSKTQSQAKALFANIKNELENNELLRADLGPFETKDEEWGAYSITIKKYGAKIIAASTDQGIRGFRHGPHRPDLIICDDIEDLQSVKTLESRDKTYQWLTGEVIPLGDVNTKTLVLGNLLHEDSVIRRLIEQIKLGKMNGEFREFPLIDSTGKIAWPGKFPDQVSIEQAKNKIGSEVSWQREYLLRIITDEDQIVKPEWIKKYERLPDALASFTATGIDLAISENSSADYTAMVSASVYGRGKESKIYILPNPINKRLDFPKTVLTAKQLSKVLGGGIPTKLFIENVGYQKALIDQLKAESYPAEEFKTHGQDKASRLQIVTHLIQNGSILFPSKGDEDLINQLLNFGKERHDDMVDAFCIVALKIQEKYSKDVNIGAKYVFSQKELKIKGDASKERGLIIDFVEPTWEYLGIVTRSTFRQNTVVVARSENSAKVLYKGKEDRLGILRNLVLQIAKKNSIPISKYQIMIEKSPAGKELSNKIASRIGSYQNFCIDFKSQPEKLESQYANLKSQGYFRLKEWLNKGASLIEPNHFSDLLDVRYMETDGRFSILDFEELLKYELPIADVSDALILTFCQIYGKKFFELRRSTPFYDPFDQMWKNI